MTSDLGGAPATNQEERPVAVTTPLRKRFGVKGFLLLVAAVIALDALALLLVPPFPRGGQPGQACDYPACFINSVLEFPPPAVVLDLSAATAPAAAPLVYFHPSISSTILTMWIVMALILLLSFLATRRMRQKPGRVQNAVEWAYEFGSDFAVGIGGEVAKPYYPIFAAFFLFLLFSNWSGLVPPVGRIEQLRAPTSDVNITIGLALTSFVLFQSEGFRRLGVRGYLGKFFPIGEFRHGLGAGILAMYVGMIELFLEFVKPVTLSMRLFGNIYGGEVALAVISGLAVAIVPVALLGLEAFLNLIQALIFSVLTLVFITMAIEGHEYEDHDQASDATSADQTRNGADSPHTAAA
ncbi:MAG TPA: F0F1 ATP synthase subunit A [Candidatus Limnocylindrales bacterium]